MLTLWLAAGLLSAVSALSILAWARWRPAPASMEEADLAVHRRALNEIDELSERGLLAQGERAAARAEAARRLLRAADKKRPPAPMAGRLWAVALVAAAAPIVATALYVALGSPSASDQPFSFRLRQWRDHPERSSGPELAAALHDIASERPRDPEPLRRLALLELSLGDVDAAVHALRRALQIAPERADLLAVLGEAEVLRAHGAVDAEAAALFRRVLRLDATSPTARFYLGRAAIADGDITAGLQTWRRLMVDLDTADPRRALLADDIASVEQTGGLGPSGPAAPAAADMGQFIVRMVDLLAARLAIHPDDPQGWVRLVRAYGVLGERSKQNTALVRARALYATRPEILAQLEAAAGPPM